MCTGIYNRPTVSEQRMGELQVHPSRLLEKGGLTSK